MWYYLCKICHKNGENAPCGGNEGKTDMKYASNNIRNILIDGSHAGSGKTTLTEALVYFYSKIVLALPSVWAAEMRKTDMKYCRAYGPGRGRHHDFGL